MKEFVNYQEYRTLCPLPIEYEVKNKTVEPFQKILSLFKEKTRSTDISREDDLLALVNENKTPSSSELKEIFALGRTMIQDGEYKSGIKIMRWMAQHGVKDANYLLGYCYEQGIGVSKDSKVAEAYYRWGEMENKKNVTFGLNKASASQIGRDLLADKSAGKLRSLEETKPKEEVKNKTSVQSNSSEKQLNQIVEKNLACTKAECESIFLLGKKLLGQGQHKLAVKYIRYAAQHGLKDANNLLGDCYAKGMGVPKDAKVAEAYYRLGNIK